MKPTPKTVKEAGDFGTVCDALVKHIETHWEGKILPKGFAKFKKGYRDYAGMEEWDNSPERKKAIKEFGSFDDSTAGAMNFVDMLSVPHVVYDDTNQGRSPLHTLISACLKHGHIRGELYGVQKGIEFAVNKISWAISRLLHDSGADEKAMVKLVKYVFALKDGQHGRDCKCYACRCPKVRLNKKQKAEMAKDLAKILKKINIKKINKKVKHDSEQSQKAL